VKSDVIYLGINLNVFHGMLRQWWVRINRSDRTSRLPLVREFFLKYVVNISCFHIQWVDGGLVRNSSEDSECDEQIGPAAWRSDLLSCRMTKDLEWPTTNTRTPHCFWPGPTTQLSYYWPWVFRKLPPLPHPAAMILDNCQSLYLLVLIPGMVSSIFFYQGNSPFCVVTHATTLLDYK
jgi:hypothetical protein